MYDYRKFTRDHLSLPYLIIFFIIIGIMILFPFLAIPIFYSVVVLIPFLLLGLLVDYIETKGIDKKLKAWGWRIIEINFYITMPFFSLGYLFGGRYFEALFYGLIFVIYVRFRNFDSDNQSGSQHYQSNANPASTPGSQTTSNANNTPVHESTSFSGWINDDWLSNALNTNFGYSQNYAPKSAQYSMRLLKVWRLPQQSNHRIEAMCFICYKSLIGEIGCCPICNTGLHYLCFTRSLDYKKECPFCKTQIFYYDFS